MKRWAMISGRIVDTVVEQDDRPELLGWYDVVVDISSDPDVGPGDGYDGAAFSKPAPVVDATLAGLIDVPAFMDRFGRHQVKILTAKTGVLKALKDYIDLRAGRWIDLSDATVVELVNSAITALTDPPAGLAAGVLDATTIRPAEQVQTRRAIAP